MLLRHAKCRGLKKEGAGKQFVCEKGELMVVMAVIIKPSCMLETMPNASCSLSRIIPHNDPVRCGFLWMRRWRFGEFK